MLADYAIAEIGSTTTLVGVFGRPSDAPANSDDVRLLCQGAALTSISLPEGGDVNVGLREAMAQCGNPPVRRRLAASSAAGGLRMSVHGLMYDMTVRAAREAALGAGANVCQVTAGCLQPADLDALVALRPTMVLLAGGVDYGERETVWRNGCLIAETFAELPRKPPVVYAGNVQNRETLARRFAEAGMECVCVDNVYPSMDTLRVEPARQAIQALFEKHIADVPGMEHVRATVEGTVLPTPRAVMLAAETLYGELGDLLVLDVGGATTDVHSVAEGADLVAPRRTGPEPRSKRTVEGDLGLYRNRANVVALAGMDALARRCGVSRERLATLIEAVGPLPETEEEAVFLRELTFEAARAALRRHAGRWRDLYGPGGRTRLAEGKDLTGVRTVIGTGGALTRLPGGRETLQRILDEPAGNRLMPPRSANVALDRDYVMAAAGVLAMEQPAEACQALKRSLEI